jgi:hypothetical protein
MKFTYKVKKSLVKEDDYDKFHENIDKDKRDSIL